jgi:hypothetical protein
MRSDAHLRTKASRVASRPAAFLVTMAMGIGLGVAAVSGYDPRLNEALAALQKAAALVEASSAGNVSTHTQREFDRHVGKALASIQEAMDHILAAGAAADSGVSAR